MRLRPVAFSIAAAVAVITIPGTRRLSWGMIAVLLAVGVHLVSYALLIGCVLIWTRLVPETKKAPTRHVDG